MNEAIQRYKSLKIFLSFLQSNLIFKILSLISSFIIYSSGLLGTVSFSLDPLMPKITPSYPNNLMLSDTILSLEQFYFFMNFLNDLMISTQTPHHFCLSYNIYRVLYIARSFT